MTCLMKLMLPLLVIKFLQLVVFPISTTLETLFHLGVYCASVVLDHPFISFRLTRQVNKRLLMQEKLQELVDDQGKDLNQPTLVTCQLN